MTADVPPGSRTIDAHLHLWRLRPGTYSWLTPALGGLYADFTAEQARVELDAAGIDDAILVQADDTVADTEFMLAVADANPWVTGVVGWIPLDAPAAAEETLDRWQGHPAFCGVRHLVHEDPRDGFLELPAVRRSLALLSRRGVAFDVPNAWPRHLAPAVALAEALPELAVVVDHLAKPPLGQPDFEAWLTTMRRVAAFGNTVVKFSGLRLPGVSFDVQTIRPLWEFALELFGPSRIMYGGDWPITVPDGGYQPTWRVVRDLVAELSPAERALVLGGTAARVYRR
ncbi:amidohydrolase family protein [Luethyella okanaganae]|uniref:Amidohydrolase family protein n=1 Tax=Luethyella okanaganae TaxID=69372 RepID=A0ABW1VK71_9MICO